MEAMFLLNLSLSHAFLRLPFGLLFLPAFGTSAVLLTPH